MAETPFERVLIGVAALAGVAALYVAYEQLEIARQQAVPIPQQAIPTASRPADRSPSQERPMVVPSYPPMSVSGIEGANLQQAAIRFAVDFMRRGGSESIEQMRQFVRNHYAPEIVYFQKGIQSQDYVITDKTKYLSAWPIRSYNVMPGISAQCDATERTCLVVGLTRYHLQGTRGIKCGTSHFEIGLEMTSYSPLLTKEQGEAVNGNSCL